MLPITPLRHVRDHQSVECGQRWKGVLNQAAFGEKRIWDAFPSKPVNQVRDALTPLNWKLTRYDSKSGSARESECEKDCSVGDVLKMVGRELGIAGGDYLMTDPTH
jgi:hypothetical protein